MGLTPDGLSLVIFRQPTLGLKSVDLDFYEDHVYEKQRRVSFSKARKTLKTEMLEFISTYGGKASVLSRSSLYFVIFIDDSSRKVWIYFFKHKSNMFNVFKKWLAQVENESGRKLKCLKSDKESEHCEGRFEEFCASQEIRKVKMVPGNPY